MANYRLIFMLAFVSSAAYSQWLNYPDPRMPRTKDGKPNLSAPAPRTGGKPDLSGVWQADYARAGENDRIFGKRLETFAVPGDDPRTFSKYFLNILSDFAPEELMRPEGIALLRRHTSPEGTLESPSTRCVPQGIPRGDLDNYLPFKIVQHPGLTLMLYEQSNTFRQIYTDGRKLPVDPQPTWLGYSVGKWEGEAFVIDSAGFNDRGWLDTMGHPQSEELRIRERFHRRDFGQMELELTVDDPKMYTRAFTVKATDVLVPGGDVLEYVCAENERDQIHLGGAAAAPR
jgi:hypothetical protein